MLRYRLRLHDPSHRMENGFSLRRRIRRPASTFGYSMWSGRLERCSWPPLLRLKGAQFQPAISPDSRWVAYQSDESGVHEVYVTKFSPERPSEAARIQISSGGGMGPVWSPNRKELLYRTPDGRAMTAAYQAVGESFTTEKPRKWVETRLL